MFQYLKILVFRVSLSFVNYWLQNLTFSCNISKTVCFMLKVLDFSCGRLIRLGGVAFYCDSPITN